MHLRRLIGSLFVLVGCSSLLASWASAQTPSRKVDPKIRRALATGVVNPWLPRGAVPTPGRASVVLELDRPLGPGLQAKLLAAGVRLSSINHRVLTHGRFAFALIDSGALSALSAMPEVLRVSLAPALGPAPIDHSAELIGLQAARGSRPALDTLQGQGVVVADLDSNADIFHPQFFRADAGYFDWIDVDGNGEFKPGIDAVDLNRDGKAGPKEVAQEVRVHSLDESLTDVPARPDHFDPAVDWLYLDENGNGERDYGAAAGFDDTAPALGEPLFVPEDVNLDHKLSVGERVVRLGTSKFRSVYVHVGYGQDVDQVYQRGVDLSAHTNEFTGGMYGFSDALHGTGVLSIVAGDVPLVGRRWVGIAPDADLLLAFEVAEEFKSLPWALQEKPSVVLHETANWTGIPLDGSDPYSALVDSSTKDDNISHSCPTGNTGGSLKHLHKVLPAGIPTTVSFEIPSADQQYVQISLNVRGAGPVTFKLQEPGGAEHEIDADPWVLSTGAYAWPTRETTTRNTHFTDIILYVDPKAGDPVPQGEWKLTTTGDATADSTLDGYLSDDLSGWSTGVSWPASEATDDRTIGVPATSDTCVAVGAHTGHAASAQEPWYWASEGPGEIRYYSGRGPRIDGAPKPDVVAPDNPWAAAPAGDMFLMGEMVPYAAVWPFSGTSGAGPHVTGVAALLAQAGIKGEKARDALRAGAIHDSLTGTTPNSEYGYGRLSAAGAFGVAAQGAPPTVTLLALPAQVTLGQTVMLQPQASDPDGPANALEAKWDDGYDGTWDLPYASVAPRSLVMNHTGSFPYKIRVRDSQGRIAEAVAWVQVHEFVEPGPEAGPEVGPDSTPDSKDTGVDVAIDTPLVPEGSDGPSKDSTVDSNVAAVDGATLGGGACACRAAPGGSSSALSWIAALAVSGLWARRRRIAVQRQSFSSRIR